MTTVTVAQSLELDVIRSAGPEVLAGAAGLDRPVRWVHSTELADIAPLLRAGDLVLSTGIALPDSEAGLRDFAASLEESEVAGIIIELGRRWRLVPAALIEACASLGLPLVALHHEVPFAAVAQALGELIVDQQLGELKEAQRVHDTFTELSVVEAGPQQILEAVQRLAGATVVLESADHQVVDFRSGSSSADAFISDWSRRSKAVRIDSRTAWDQRYGWLATRLGRRERGWGRLVVQCPDEPSQRLVAVVERGAAALAMHRLQDRHRDSQVRRTHHELILGLLHDPADEEVLRRCEAAGFPVSKHHYVAMALLPVVSGKRQPTNALDDVLAATVHTAHTSKVPALISDVDRVVRVLLAIPAGRDPEALTEAIAAAARQRCELVATAGRPATTVGDVDRTMRESVHVLTSVRLIDRGASVNRLEDVHLRGLLAMMHDDDRLRLFVEREIAPLRSHDERSGTDYVSVLRALLEHPSSKSEAAASISLSRPVFYDRVAKIERLLDVDLQDPDIRVSLHVALLAEDLLTSPAG